ncbi:MAG: hypothetical protein ACRD2F_02115 [Terriglobales bacterium]
MQQAQRFGRAPEKVAEEILTDCFTVVLDWPLESMNYQVERADFVLTMLGIKRLVIEAKRPGALQWNRAAVDRALQQARRYAAEQRITCAAVSDGVLVYAEDLGEMGPQARLLASLEAAEAPEELWWLSQEGVYRRRDRAAAIAWPESAVVCEADGTPPGDSAELLHGKYHLPARCFAYVPDPTRPGTWKLPYLSATGAVDGARLPKAIQCILTNYRGARAQIPEPAIPAILGALETAARRAGHMPDQDPATAPAYRQLAAALEQINRDKPKAERPALPGSGTAGEKA